MGRVCGECIRLLTSVVSELSAADAYETTKTTRLEEAHLNGALHQAELLVKRGCALSDVFERMKKFVEMHDYAMLWRTISELEFHVTDKCQLETRG
jgi:hypothetical protein